MLRHVDNGILITFLFGIMEGVSLCAKFVHVGQYPTDHLAYCVSTGGRALIIGSAAGVAAMGMERIDFFWYLRRVTVWAVLGYLSGAAAFVVQHQIFH